jgi:hypothetical protein
VGYGVFSMVLTWPDSDKGLGIIFVVALNSQRAKGAVEENGARN